jgi:nicotinamidase-related amidase
MAFSNAALLIMDFQQDVVAMLAPGGSGTAVERARAAIDGARAHRLPVIFVRVAFRAGYPEAAARNKRISALRDKGLLRESSPGAQIASELDPRPDDAVVVKRRVSALAHTDLATLLRANAIDTLVLSGLATSGVVLSTVRQAADADYRVVVLEDACADADAEVHRVLMSKVFPTQASVITVQAFLHELAA